MALAPPGRYRRSPSSDDSFELRAEVVSLQEKEATLLHILSLEKERRVQAEQLVEVEKMACLELSHRLRGSSVGYMEDIPVRDSVSPDVSPS